MAETIRPSVGERQQVLEVSQESQKEGNHDQDSAQSLPLPGSSVPNQPPAYDS
jgi:hypothetical protein